MHFKLNVNLTDEIYYDFNKFFMFHSKNSARITTLTRVTVFLMYFVFGWLFCMAEGFSVNTCFFIGYLIITMILLQIFLKKLLWLSLKLRLNAAKKKGKLKYSPVSVLEFYDDFFCETTDDQKSEMKYSVIECVRVIRGNMVLLQKYEGLAFIVPISCFRTKEQYDEFLSFIKAKCSKVDYFEKI